MKALDNFYLQQEEPTKSCLLALKEIILSQKQKLITIIISLILQRKKR